MKKPFYVTTPIYYVNDKPHIGHAYTSIAADILARFHRLAGREAYFLTGTDEHGSKVAEAAARAGLSEIEFCDRTAQTFVDAWKLLSVEYDDFIRTTSPRHEKAVLKILDAFRGAKTPDGQDVIYVDYYEGLYCTGCEKFITEKELVDGLCPNHKTRPETLREKNYFFRLSAYLPSIREKIERNELVILPDERRREVLGLIGQDIPDFSLSRERVKWGIRLPFDPSQSAYVWVDALTNYISAIGYADNPQQFARWWTGGDVLHLMAKDILKFHCIFWPAMLMAAGVKLPETIFLHGFFTVDGEKMSKSLGNKIDPEELVGTYGPDGTRYLLLTQFPFGIDGDVQVERFMTQYNSDLANDLGNLVSRVAKMIVSNFDGRIPERNDSVAGLPELITLSEKMAPASYAAIEEYRLGAAIGEAMNLVKATNKFFNDTAPWKMVKDGKLAQMGGVLYACAEVLRIVSIVLFPVMPNKMRELRRVFGLDDTGLTLADASRFGLLAPGGPVAIDIAVFPRLNAESGENRPPAAPAAPVDEANLLDISEFGRVQLRVAQVLEAEPVAGASKLLRLQIDLGDERRQIVAGIAEYYTPEKIVGKKIVVVANLKPAVIRGVESRGMLLAAKKGKQLTILTIESDLPPGATVS